MISHKLHRSNEMAAAAAEVEKSLHTTRKGLVGDLTLTKNALEELTINAEDAAAELFGRRRGAAVARRRGALLRAVQGARVVLESMICNSEALLSLEPTHLSLDS